MRVIEPVIQKPKQPAPKGGQPDTTQPDTPKPPKKRTKRRKKILFLLFFILATTGVASWYLDIVPTKQPDAKPQQSSPKVANTTAQAPTEVPDTKPKTLKTFTGQQFLDLYQKVYYPNTQPITEKPVITGNVAADERIRQIAEKRGYALRSIPVAPIVKIGDPNLDEDDLLQQKALDAWRIMQANAKKDGLPLRILSGYRSPSLQRSIFLNRLNGYSVTYEQIAAGNGDDAVVSLLTTTSIPGYSRHHTGYTIDLQCDNGSLEAFESSPCYTWISKNNYQQAKIAGWIPSYPSGADKQGPEPEPWEFVWVGTDMLYE